MDHMTNEIEDIIMGMASAVYEVLLRLKVMTLTMAPLELGVS